MIEGHELFYVLRRESPEERTGMPIPTLPERSQAYELLPNTPLDKDDALAYGALMFALGRRQITLEVTALLKEKKLIQ